MVSSRVGSWAATTPNATQAIMQRSYRFAWSCLPWGKANEGVPRPQRAQLRERARGGSVFMRLPPGIWISGCGVVQHKLQSRRTRVFPQHGSARGVAGSRGRTGCEGLRRFTLKICLEPLSSAIERLRHPLHHCKTPTHHCNVAAFCQRCRRGRGQSCRVHRCPC